MKLKARRLRYTIWLYFILFALGLMCIVWVLQVVFTENNLVKSIESSMITAGESLETRYLNAIEDSVDISINDDFTSYAKSVKEMDNVFVVFTTQSYNGIGEMPSYCYPYDKTVSDKYYDEYGDIIRQAKKLVLNAKDGDFSGAITSNENKTDTMFVYAKVVDGAEGLTEPVYIVLLTSLNNIDNVLLIIQSQLGVISLIIIVVAFVISMLISANISQPLVNMSRTARRLAHGDFSVEFTANAYSEVNELSQSLNDMKEELQRAGILQRELMANVTHDLKTPLTMVKAYAEMIKDISGDNKEKRDKHAQVIIDEADRLTMLVNDILNLSKVQSSVDALELKRVNISQLLNKVIDRFTSFLESNGYFIKSEITENAYALCDPQKIEQVFYNLIGNAINYTGENKTVEVYLSVVDRKILFEVVDSGKGIDKDKIDTIWEKYYRASETHKRPVKGTGLGLSIVKAILDGHGFKYGVISKPNKGSNFFVELPVENGGAHE